MTEHKRVDLFCEDRGHEQYVVALVKRIARDEQVQVDVHSRSARGGHPRAIQEFRAWQRAFAHGLSTGTPDLLVVVIDGNCTGWHPARKTIEAVVDQAVFPRVAVGCPDPHVERWCFADRQAFASIVGIDPPADPGKCERDYYKELLRSALVEAGHPVLTDPMEFAEEIVNGTDLSKAAATDQSLRDFVRQLRAGIQA